jgi:probable O-glycosylation ligase (exosortase A-associated)
MRDLLIIAIVVFAALVALRHGWVGVMLWTWLSLMNPHRYAYGFAYDAPVAAIAAAASLLGLLLSKDRQSPMKGAPVTIFVIFNIWITISLLMGLDPAGDYDQWKKVMKINFMLFVALALLNDKRHIMAFAWVCALSLGILGAKGGVFTIMSGGSNKVWGPPGTFIEDNNEFALALIITIPLLRFLQLQISNVWGRRALLLLMLLCAASALGSHSRGALLAIGAMTIMLWWRGSKKAQNGLFLLVIGAALVAFMPAEWSARMDTINDYEHDASAMGRFSAWGMAWNAAFHYPFGVGFNAARPELFDQYGPYGLTYGTPAAHSVYFQVLGNHGFVGIFIYLAMWVATFRWCSAIRRESKGIPQAAWCHDLAGMIQVSLVGFAVGGVFLSLAYFDQPYNLMVLAVLTLAWVRSRAWERQPAFLPAWIKVPGVGTPMGVAKV